MTTLKLHSTFTPQDSCKLLGMFSTKDVQRIVNFHILNFWHFFRCPWNRNPSVVRPSSVGVAIIYVPNAWISFKFWLLLPLCHTLGRFFFFFFFFFFFVWFFSKKNIQISDILWFFSLSLTWDPMGQNFKTILQPLIASKSFKLWSFNVSFHWSSSFEFLKFLKLKFYLFHLFYFR